MMTGEAISAVEAERIGMIYKVFSKENFEEEKLKLANKLAKMPTKALALTKKLLNLSLENNLDQQLEEEENQQVIAGNTNDYKEGITSFLEKRKPNFKGN